MYISRTMRKLLLLLVILSTVSLPLLASSAGREGKAEIAFAEGMLAYNDQDYSGAHALSVCVPFSVCVCVCE